MALTSKQVGDALARLGKYRVQAALLAADEGPPDGISGSTVLALGLRESLLQNINNKAQTDKGCFQITEAFHADFLKSEPGCPEKTWTAVNGHTAFEDGYCPRYTPAMNYALAMLKSGRWRAKALGVPGQDAVRVAISAYNQGFGGAMKGWRAGDVDAGTTGGEYSAWVLEHRSIINRVLTTPRFDGWQVA